MTLGIDRHMQSKQDERGAVYCCTHEKGAQFRVGRFPVFKTVNIIF